MFKTYAESKLLEVADFLYKGLSAAVFLILLVPVIGVTFLRSIFVLLGIKYAADMLAQLIMLLAIIVFAGSWLTGSSGFANYGIQVVVKTITAPIQEVFSTLLYYH